MTREKWAKMSDVERNYKVCELRGAKWWRLLPFDDNKKSLAMPGNEGQLYLIADCNETICQIHSLPDHLHDLNVMHETEKTMNCDEVGQYEWHLNRITHDCAFTATAVQRAEAFCLAMEPE